VAQASRAPVGFCGQYPLWRVPHPFAFCAKGWAAQTSNPQVDTSVIPTLAKDARMGHPDSWRSGAGPALPFACATTNEAAPAFVVFESWAPHSLRAGLSSRHIHGRVAHPFDSTTAEGAPLLRFLQGWEPRTDTRSPVRNRSRSRCRPPFRTNRERMGHPQSESVSEIESLGHPPVVAGNS
jgi:hypothetical protein